MPARQHVLLVREAGLPPTGSRQPRRLLPFISLLLLHLPCTPAGQEGYMGWAEVRRAINAGAQVRDGVGCCAVQQHSRQAVQRPPCSLPAPLARPSLGVLTAARSAPLPPAAYSRAPLPAAVYAQVVVSTAAKNAYEVSGNVWIGCDVPATMQVCTVCSSIHLPAPPSATRAQPATKVNSHASVRRRAAVAAPAVIGHRADRLHGS